MKKGPMRLRQLVDIHIAREVYSRQLNREAIWGRFRVATILRVYVHHALTNTTVLAHLLDPSVWKFDVFAPEDQADHTMYTNAPGSNEGFSQILMTARHHARGILADLRNYVVNPYHQVDQKRRVYMPDNIKREYAIMYEFHSLYRPISILRYPLNDRRTEFDFPGGNQRFIQTFP